MLDGDKVKISLRFMGRELAHQEVGHELIARCIDYVKDIAMIESNPKMEGKTMFLLLAPDSLKIKDYLKAHPPKEGKQEELPELTDVVLEDDED
jgi:translation initiation factor IF-3